MMPNTTVSRPVYPGTTGHGAAWKEVVVLAVDREQNVAVCRDQLGQDMRVRCDIMRAKGNLPAVNERWLVDRQYNDWTFAAIMNGGTKGVIIPPASVTGLPETLADHVDLINNVDNQAQARDTSIQATATTLQNATLGQAVAKGDLLAATGPGVVVRKPVGTDGQVLVADSAFASGLGYRNPLALTQAVTGAVAPVRYVGGTTSGAPTTGNFLKGDYITTQSGYMWICTVAGTPGTWVCKTFDVETRAGALEDRAGSLEGRAAKNETNGKHIWSLSGGTGSSGDHVAIGWVDGFDSGIASRGGNSGELFFFNRSGRWAVTLFCTSDGGSTGVWSVYTAWGSPNPIGTNLIDSRWRGGGFGGAGTLRQVVSWSGWVAPADAAVGFGVWFGWAPAAVVTCPCSFRLTLEYLGPF